VEEGCLLGVAHAGTLRTGLGPAEELEPDAREVRLPPPLTLETAAVGRGAKVLPVAEPGSGIPGVSVANQAAVVARPVAPLRFEARVLALLLAQKLALEAPQPVAADMAWQG